VYLPTDSFGKKADQKSRKQKAESRKQKAEIFVASVTCVMLAKDISAFCFLISAFLRALTHG
jgi:hypothetical protein